VTTEERVREAVMGFDFERFAKDISRVLSDRGLLVTDLHRRALEACERFARAWDANPDYYYDNSTDGPITQDTLAVGRESLAAKEAAKPKPRWTVHAAPDNGDSFYIMRDEGKGPMMTGLTWKEACAAHKALNNLEAAK